MYTRRTDLTTGCIAILIFFIVLMVLFAGISWLIFGVALPIFWEGCPHLTFWQHVAVGAVLSLVLGMVKGSVKW